MRRRFWGFWVFAALVAALILPAGAAWAKKKVIFTSGAEALSLDPTFHPGGTPDNLLQTAPYDSLVYQDPDGTIRPALAASWEFKDPAHIVFKLRRGVRFHDGTPFDAAAVKFGWERTIKEKGARLAGYIRMIESIRVIDDFTLEVKLKFPYAPILANLSMPIASIASPAAIKRWGKEFRRNPVGTGPFVFKGWVPGEYVRFEANPNYWGGKPAIDELEYRLIPEDTTRVLQLRAGQVHLALYLPPAQMADVERDPKLDLVRVPLFRVVYIGMSNRTKPFDNPLVRQAVNYAVDTRVIQERLLLGVGTPIRGTFGPAVWGYDPAFETMGYAYDPEKARELLRQAGYPEGFETEFWHPSGRYTGDRVTAEAIQAQLARVGIRLKLRTGDWGLVAPTIRKGAAPIYLYGWGVTNGDADVAMYFKFHSSQWGAPGNYDRYKNPEVDRLLDAGRRTILPDPRKALYKEAMRLVLRDGPWIPLRQEVMLVGKSKKLQGVILHPSERLYFDKARLED